MIDTSKSFGIDKVILKTKEFAIKNAQKSGFTVQPASIDLATGQDGNGLLFKDGNGSSISGLKAYRNTELSQVTVDGYGFLTVQFNPLKAVHGYNLASTDQVFQERLQIVLKDLTRQGISASWNDATLHRIDVARNVLTSEPVNTYNPVYPWMNVKRVKRQSQYPDGYSIGNNSVGFIFYNKGLESKDYEAEGYKPFNGNNLLRAEVQYKKAKAIQSCFGCKVLKHIAEVGIIHFQDRFRKDIADRVFRQTVLSNQHSLAFNDHVEMLKHCKALYPRKAIGMLLETQGIPNFLQTYGSISNFEKVLAEAGYQRNAIYKASKKINALLSLYNQLHKADNNILTRKYHELQLKLTA
jgi:hypothetical protein